MRLTFRISMSLQPDIKQVYDRIDDEFHFEMCVCVCLCVFLFLCMLYISFCRINFIAVVMFFPFVFLRSNCIQKIISHHLNQFDWILFLCNNDLGHSNICLVSSLHYQHRPSSSSSTLSPLFDLSASFNLIFQVNVENVWAEI